MKNKVKSFFKNHPSVKVKSKELSQKLYLTKPHEYAQLKHTLHKLETEGYIEKQGKRYSLSTKHEGKLIGRLQIINDGAYGFVILEASKLNDVYVSERNLGTAFHGDRVEVTLFARQKGKNLEGQIIRVVSREKEEVTGVLKKTKSFFFVLPDDEHIHRDIYIPKEDLNGAKSGDKVVVSGLEWNSSLLNPEGYVKEILGKAGSYDAEIAALAREFNLNYRFPDAVIDEVRELTDEIEADELAKRLDYREENVFTIDPETAKDFDDAVSVKKAENGNLIVGVHIADVGHFIDLYTDLFQEAAERATSVYFVGRVVPMLPEKLSNNLCSLVPNKDRYTFSVIIEMTPRAKIVDYKITKAVINSKRRFSYEEVQEILDSGNGDFVNEIVQLNKLAKMLKKKRENRGSINFQTSEVEFELDKNGVPIEIKKRRQDESHSLIEEFMLLTNQIIAEYMGKKENKKKYPFVYRVHDLPDEAKVNEFSVFVKTLGYNFNPGNGNLAKQFQFLFNEVQDTPEAAIVNDIGIRSMAKAIYTIHNIGHFGLAFKHYTHFTSPIRRFPDLLVHKILHNQLEGNEVPLFNEDELEELCDHSSDRERNAVQAERVSVKIKQIEYMKNKIGEVYEGVISGITNFGMFVQVKDNLAEGLIRLRDMDDDYYIYDEKAYSLLGEVTGKVYRLGDVINIKVKNVIEEKRVIDFTIVN